MALVNCPDCGKQVSSSAPACVSCGAPIASAVGAQPESASTPPRASAPEVQTIEQTGKKYKAQQALGCVVALVSGLGVFTAAVNDDTDLTIKFMLGTLLGSVWYLGARVFAWWKHG